MNFDFVVLGATGLQGRIAARDLLEKGYSVLLCGRDKARIQFLLEKFPNAEFQEIEAKKIKTIFKAIKYSKANVVLNCIEGDWNLDVFNVCARAKVNCLDLGSEIPETKKQLALHPIFKKNNLVAITGIGSVPGTGNVMLRYACEKLSRINDIEVGFAWNSNLKSFVVPFSIESIIEEFTELAPVVENKHFIKKVPLDTIIKEYHRSIGQEKEFFVRHPEQYTFFRYFKKKGVKNIRFYAGFPEHSFRVIKALIDVGMGSKEEIDYYGIKIKPVNFLTQVLKQIKIPPGYKEKENLWVRVKGEAQGKKKEILMECLVPTLDGWEDAGCNIDTGIPASILAEMIKNGQITEKGSFAPEAVVPPEIFFPELRKKGMKVLENGVVIN